jgi:hypothetical protein
MTSAFTNALAARQNAVLVENGDSSARIQRISIQFVAHFYKKTSVNIAEALPLKFGELDMPKPI